MQDMSVEKAIKRISYILDKSNRLQVYTFEKIWGDTSNPPHHHNNY